MSKTLIASYTILHGGNCVLVKTNKDTNSSFCGEEVNEEFKNFISTNSETFIAEIYSIKETQERVVKK